MPRLLSLGIGDQRIHSALVGERLAARSADGSPARAPTSTAAQRSPAQASGGSRPPSPTGRPVPSGARGCPGPTAANATSPNLSVTALTSAVVSGCDCRNRCKRATSQTPRTLHY